MKINGTQSTAVQSVKQNLQSDDPVIKNAQSQIEELQKRIQALAKNEDMDADTKREKRQELQQQISDLQATIRQRQMELRNMKQQESMEKAEAARAKKAPEAVKKAKQAGAFTTRGLNAVLSAGNAMEISKTQGSVATSFEGRANVLETEIELDKARGADTSYKSKELSDINRRAGKSRSDQIETLGKAAKDISEVNQDENKKTAEQDEDETVIGTLYGRDGKLQDKNGEQEPEYQAKA